MTEYITILLGIRKIITLHKINIEISSRARERFYIGN